MKYRQNETWTYMKKRSRRTFEEKVKSTRLCFSHECRGLVSSSEYRPWVGCPTLSLRSYSAGTASDRAREIFFKQNTVARRWFSISPPGIPLSCPAYYWRKFIGSFILLDLNDIGSGWGSFMQTPGSCGLEKTVDQINQHEWAREEGEKNRVRKEQNNSWDSTQLFRHSLSMRMSLSSVCLHNNTKWKYNLLCQAGWYIWKYYFFKCYFVKFSVQISKHP